MKKTSWILILVLALALTACGGAAAPTPIPTVSLDEGESGSGLPATASGETVVASAEVRPMNSVDLSFPMLGTVTSVEVEVGDSVTAGQTIATLDTTILEARIAEAEAGVVAAQTQVDYLKRVGVGNAYEQIDAAQAEVDRAASICS